MPSCKQCGLKFPTRTVIEGLAKNLGNRKYCLTCSPFGAHNTRRIHVAGTAPVGHCTVCGRDYTYDAKAGHNRTKCNSCSVLEVRTRIKLRALAYKGGRCQMCGYDRCSDALDFHHRDPRVKEFQIQDGHYRKWTRLQPELDKCDLLCCRCHREVHAGLHLVGGQPKLGPGDEARTA